MTKVIDLKPWNSSDHLTTPDATKAYEDDMTNAANAYLSICAPIDCGTKEAAKTLADWVGYYNMRIHTTNVSRPDHFPTLPTEFNIENIAHSIMIRWTSESPIVTLTSVDNHTSLQNIYDLIQALMRITPEMPQAQGIQYARWMLTPSPDIYSGGYFIIRPEGEMVIRTTFDLMQDEIEEAVTTPGGYRP